MWQIIDTFYEHCIYFLTWTWSSITYSILSRHDSMHRGVQSPQLDFSFELGSCLLPVWSQSLTVPAPGSIELNQPHVVTVQDSFLKIGVSQLNDIFWVALWEMGICNEMCAGKGIFFSSQSSTAYFWFFFCWQQLLLHTNVLPQNTTVCSLTKWRCVKVCSKVSFGRYDFDHIVKATRRIKKISNI